MCGAGMASVLALLVCIAAIVSSKSIMVVMLVTAWMGVVYGAMWVVIRVVVMVISSAVSTLSKAMVVVVVTVCDAVL